VCVGGRGVDVLIQGDREKIETTKKIEYILFFLPSWRKREMEKKLLKY